MKSYRYELYKYIETWLIEQDTQHILLDMTMSALLKHTIELPPGYDNYWGPTKSKSQRLTRLKVMQGFLPTGIWQQ